MKSNRARIAVLAIAAALALPAGASTLDLFAIGSSHTGGAVDPLGNPLAGNAVVSWTETLPAASLSSTASMMLSILAEGIDGGPLAPNGGEHDGVYVNGQLVGYLVQQAFYTPGFELQPGPGAVPGVTAETTSLFDVTRLVVAGLNTFEIRVDSSNWVDEIEVVSLAPRAATVPEPSSAALLAVAMAGVAAGGRRRRPR